MTNETKKAILVSMLMAVTIVCVSGAIMAWVSL